MRIIINIIVLAFLLSTSLIAQEDRGLYVVEDLGDEAVVGKQYLVLIGIDSYDEWGTLKNPVQDAKELKQILTSQYYIDEVRELYNEDATKANIMRLFENLQNEIKLDDSLLVFYAGHGHLDKKTKSGFWIPVNAGTDEYEQANWIPNTQVIGLLSQMESIHQLLISDSCFSGDLLEAERVITPKIDSEYFKRAYSKVSRQILTSGALETVPDKSEFAEGLKLTLKKNKSKYIDPLIIFSEVRDFVTKSEVMFGSMSGANHQKGASFLLFRRPDEVPTPKLGSLIVKTNTKGKIFIDEKSYGEISEKIKLDNIDAGDHLVKIIFSDNSIDEQKINIKEETMELVTFKWIEEVIEPAIIKLYSIEIETMSEGILFIDEVFHSNIDSGMIKIDDLTPGTHNVKLIYDDTNTEEHEVTVSENNIEKLVFIWVPVEELKEKTGYSIPFISVQAGGAFTMSIVSEFQNLLAPSFLTGTLFLDVSLFAFGPFYLTFAVQGNFISHEASSLSASAYDLMIGAGFGGIGLNLIFPFLPESSIHLTGGGGYTGSLFSGNSEIVSGDPAIFSTFKVKYNLFNKASIFINVSYTGVFYLDNMLHDLSMGLGAGFEIN